MELKELSFMEMALEGLFTPDGMGVVGGKGINLLDRSVSRLPDAFWAEYQLWKEKMREVYEQNPPWNPNFPIEEYPTLTDHRDPWTTSACPFCS